MKIQTRWDNTHNIGIQVGARLPHSAACDQVHLCPRLDYHQRGRTPGIVGPANIDARQNYHVRQPQLEVRRIHTNVVDLCSEPRKARGHRICGLGRAPCSRSKSGGKNQADLQFHIGKGSLNECQVYQCLRP